MKRRLTHLPHPNIFALPLLISIVTSFAFAGPAADPFADFIRKTDPLTPEQERDRFHLPPGFEIQLIASEPEIGKPMNMAFDVGGRLWITQSREYPFAAPLDKPAGDKIKVLADFDENGRARKITTFAEGLNIPIGLYPYKNGVIAFSIPYIYFFQDTDENGHADKQEMILGRFGFEKDVHGLTSAFRRGFDGWIYADHGYRNNTTLKGTDGHTITMNSGNTYRLKLDGSRVEQFTWGQVNPFGLMFDPHKLGLQRGEIQIFSDDPDMPLLHLSVVGTGLADVDPATAVRLGDDYVMLEALDSNDPIRRAISDAGGNWQLNISPGAAFHLEVLDTASGLVADAFGTADSDGILRGTDFPLFFHASTALDSDGDGLPDDIDATCDSLALTGLDRRANEVTFGECPLQSRLRGGERVRHEWK